MLGSSHTDRQTDTHTHMKVNTEDNLSGFQEFFLQPIIKDQSNYQTYHDIPLGIIARLIRNKNNNDNLNKVSQRACITEPSVGKISHVYSMFKNDDFEML